MTDLEHLADELETFREHNDRLREQNDRLAARVDALEDRDDHGDQDALESQTDRGDHEDRLAAVEADNERLRTENEALRAHTDGLEERLGALEDRVDALDDETTRIDRATQAAHRRGAACKERIAELQARELEKGAHLQSENVDPADLDVAGDRVEKLTKAKGSYLRLPDQADPLDRGGDTTLAHGDLLPIQQLARMDEDMLRSTTNALPTRLAAELWKARTDETVGDDPWRAGSKTVEASVKASDLKHWIRRQEPGTSESYAKKLVSRTIDALLELSKHRLAVHRRKERKNGLQYTERRVVLPADAEIPGESARTDADAPETADVHG